MSLLRSDLQCSPSKSNLTERKREREKYRDIGYAGFEVDTWAWPLSPWASRVTASGNVGRALRVGVAPFSMETWDVGWRGVLE